MKPIIELIVEMAGYLVLLFAVIWAFVRFTGYGKYYDQMLYGDNDSETTIDKDKKDKDIKDNSEDKIHHVEIKKINEKWKQNY